MRIVPVLTLAVLLVVMVGLFFVLSWGKSTGLAIQPLEEGAEEKGKAMAFLTTFTPFFLGVVVVAVVGVLLWITNDFSRLT